MGALAAWAYLALVRVLIQSQNTVLDLEGEAKDSLSTHQNLMILKSAAPAAQLN